VLQALGTIWFRFLQKKYLKKFHACVPLIGKLRTGRSVNFVQHFPMDFLFFLFALERNPGFVSWNDSGFHIRVFSLQNPLLYPEPYFFKTKCSMFRIIKFDVRPNFYEIMINMYR
jgi:hypothetical protein